jgi:membrane protein
MPETGLASTIKQTFNEFAGDDCGTLAAALAYYTVFSLPAMLLIIITVIGSVFGKAAVQGTIQQQLTGVMGPQAAAQVQTMVAKAGIAHGAGIVATVLGIAGLIWSSTNVVAQLHTALNRAWQVERQTSLKGEARRRITSFLLIVAVGLVVVIFLAISAAASSFVTSIIGVPGPLLEAAQAVVSWVIFTFLFRPFTRCCPMLT